MPRLILILLIALAVWYGWQYVKSRPPGERKRLYWVFGSSALLIVAVLLLATGRMHWVGVALAALIPLVKVMAYWLPRLLPVMHLVGRRMGPSTLKTRGLTVTFDFAGGTASGQLFEGPYASKELGDLDEEQLKEQLAFFQNSDRQSALLLQAYMLRKGFSGFSNAGQATDLNEPLTESEALQILGLETGASREDILKAHKRLIQKLHPDRGGNAYLAAKVNAARDRLVKT
ncbi:MAG: molecular chaperone DnaJ [Porticoccaceae bacterium]